MKKQFLKLCTLATFSLAITMTSCKKDDTNEGLKKDEGGSSFVVDKNNLQGKITKGEVTLKTGTYKLNGALVVEDGATLTIEKGVRIEATDIDATHKNIRYIAVAQGGKINIKGTATEPVVMTAVTQQKQAWGGLVLCGKAPINKGNSATSEVAELTYGGNNADDNSGSIQYLRIEYSGYNYNSEKEFNGLSMFGVGSGTSINYVQVYEGADDGFEWFGGTVNANNLVVTNKEVVPDDLFDWTEGWSGKGENWYGIRTADGNRGFEADNNSKNQLATPISFPTIKNITLVGNSISDKESQGMKLRVGTKGIFENVVLKGWKTGIDIENDATLGYVGNDILVKKVRFIDVETKSVGKKDDKSNVDVTASFTEDNTATGAGNVADLPDWAKGWTK